MMSNAPFCQSPENKQICGISIVVDIASFFIPDPNQDQLNLGIHFKGNCNATKSWSRVNWSAGLNDQLCWFSSKKIFNHCKAENICCDYISTNLQSWRYSCCTTSHCSRSSCWIARFPSRSKTACQRLLLTAGSFRTRTQVPELFCMRMNPDKLFN